MALGKGSYGCLSGTHRHRIAVLIRKKINLSEQLSLFLAETFLSFGGFMNGKWVKEGKLWVGTACSFQGE